MLYSHSAGSVMTWMSYGDKIEQLDTWHKDFPGTVQARYNNFIGQLEDELNSKINYAVNNYYDDKNGKKVSAYWKNAIANMDINGQCKDFIVSIGAEATKKTHELSDELSQDLQYSGVAFKPPPISLPDISTTLRDLGKLAPLLAFTPVGWVGAAAFGLFSILFGESREKQISKAKASLRETLSESRDEIISKTRANVNKIIKQDILGNQIKGFRAKLVSMQQMLTELSRDQNQVATTLNSQYKALNSALLIRAAMYADIPHEKLKQVSTCRIVGEEFLITINEGNLSEGDRRKLS